MSSRRLSLLWVVVALGCAREPAPDEQAAAEPAEPAVEVSARAQPVALPPAPAATRTREADGMSMVWVAAGKFLMGSDESPYQAERPEHKVRLDGFWIDRLEVSNFQYRRCVETGGCSESVALSDRYRNSDRQPALASWEDAAAYCEWVAARLPTEAEWEKAARGTDGRLWPWGHEFDASHANLLGDDDGFSHTAPVGSFPSGASPYGVLDMAGNAAEWVADFHDPSYYQSLPRRNPAGPAAGGKRVYRSTIASGGGGPEKSRTVARYGASTDWELGFRCAASGKGPANLRRTAARKSPLAKVLPPTVVPAAAALAGVSLLSLWNLLGGLALKILRMVVSDKVVTRFRQEAVDPVFRGLCLWGVRIKLREWIAIVTAASVFAASLSYSYLQPHAPVLGLLLLTIIVNAFVYGVRHLTRLFLDQKYERNTEYRMWLWGAFVTAVSAWLGNTFGLAGYIVGGGDKREGRVAYTCNVVSFTAFVVFWTLNRFNPTVVFQMVMLLSIAITFLQMLPFSPFDGKAVYHWKRRLWWMSFIPLAIIYVLTNLAH